MNDGNRVVCFLMGSSLTFVLEKLFLEEDSQT